MFSFRDLGPRPVLCLVVAAALLPSGMGASTLDPLVPSAAIQEAAAYEGPVVLDNSQLLYTAADRLTFRTGDYLSRVAPELSALRPAIDTWSSQLGVHPRAVIEVLLQYPTSFLESADGIAVDAVIEAAQVLFEVFHAEGRDEPLAASRALIAAFWSGGFAEPVSGSPLAQPWSLPQASTAEPRIFGYFQPPWEVGDTWAGGGAHGSSGDGVRNSLDFWGSYRVWGEDVSQWRVAATQAGTVRVWSSCGLSIVHPNGWITDYYHLDDIQVQDGQQVERNQHLASYANTEAQATCEGGSASGPHIHLSLFYNSERVSIDADNVDFTSFAHHAGSGQYDTDCSRAWYDHASRGQVCPNHDFLLNDAALPSPLIFADGFESGNLSAWD